MPGKAKLNDMIEYLVSHFSGNALTRTKLVKLLYLADRESYIARDRQISNLNYIKYHYGPYSEDIVDTLQEMDGDKIRELSGRSSNGTYYRYEANSDYEGSTLTREERAILKQVLREFEDTQTKQLVETVYDLDDLDSIEKYTPLLQDTNVNVEQRAVNS
ncbi:Panacea domain-containing protein [Natrinema gari]|uniref:Antitoxin SocA-like Panacea domain-containing protein n=1 Tax=Natrinema gari JCM 14663 TaxID=1230459 RepID=L9YWS9_9EURY|nr:Panacea domain-containing protein [Natrinema gari]ELY77942.1 hypothetical protein C486_13762 [Natrinema gari JCM 14663]